MSDNLRQYRAIRDALRQAYPGEPQGRSTRHLTTLAAMISGSIASKSTQLPKVAAKVPTGIKPESRVKRYARWLDNETLRDEKQAIVFKPGDKIEVDGEIMILESMKMEIPVLSPKAGTIKEIRVAEGEAIGEGQLVAILDA